MGQEYQLLQIESEQVPKPQPAIKRYYIIGTAVLCALVVLLATLAIVLTPHSHNLDVLPDNTPASKRGAGLLLT